MSQGPLLIVSPRIVGHFTVYAADCMHWALARGREAVFLGHGFEGTHLFARYGSDPRVRFLDLAVVRPELRPMSPGGDAALVPHFFSGENALVQAGAIREIQEESGAPLTLLLNSDDMLFRSEVLSEPGTFAGPTFGVFTFGHRDHYAGYRDFFNQRFARLLEGPGALAGAFTLDEYHVRAKDPGQRFLRFFPDPYRDHQPMPDSNLPEADARVLDRLRDFLAADDRPLIPVIGKLDGRKNLDWILEMGLKHPDLTFAVLGERVPGEHDARASELLERFTAEGRAFAHGNFAPEHLFDPVLESPRARFLPLAYSGHYGSSAIQLHGLRNGLPCLVPDIGLMAFRTVDHGLGGLYRHGDKADFRRAFSAMLACERIPEAGPRFAAQFSGNRLAETLDAALAVDHSPAPDLPEPSSGKKTDPAFPVPAHFAACRQGLALLAGNMPREAAEVFQAALDAAPGNAVLRFRLGLARHFSGDTKGGFRILDELAAELPDYPEFPFLVEAMDSPAREFALLEDAREIDRRNRTPGNLLAPLWQEPGDDQGKLRAAEFILRFDPDNVDGLYLKLRAMERLARPEETLAFLEKLVLLPSPDQLYYLQSKGGRHAALKEYGKAEASFRQALGIDPDFHDLRLNLSDTLRYAGRLDEAMDELRRLQSLAPSHPGLHLKKAQVLFAAGNAQAAGTSSRLKPATWSGNPFSGNSEKRSARQRRRHDPPASDEDHPDRRDQRLHEPVLQLHAVPRAPQETLFHGA